MSNLSTFEGVSNLNTSIYSKKNLENSDLSINTPYITRKFSSLISKQANLKSTAQIGKF